MKKYFFVTLIGLSLLFLVGCDNTPPATEEELARINSEAQQAAKADRLKNATDYNESTKSTGNDIDLWQVVTDKTTLNIREAPSIDSKKVGYLKKGAVARISEYDETGEWGFVDSLESIDTEGFVRGWISLEYCTDNIAMGGGWVFLVPEGSYYHIRSCEELSGYPDNMIKAWPADQAGEDGYEPCPKCGGF